MRIGVQFLKRIGLAACLLGGASRSPAFAMSVRTSPAQGDQWATLSRIGSALKIRYSIPGKQEMRLQGARRFSFEPGGRALRVDGQLVWLNAPTLKIGRNWAMTKTDADLILAPLVNPAETLRGVRVRNVLLDPGHGGKDTGAISAGGLQEKKVTLDIARRLRARLAPAGIRVVLTREDDRDLDLAARSEAALRRNADLFISLHLNAASSRAAQGIETHVLTSPGYPSTAVASRPVRSRTELPGHKYGAASTLLGFQLQKTLVAKLGETDRGVRRSNFAVLRGAPCPAVLVECGFITYAPTERQFKTDAYLDRIAGALAEGVLSYARDVQAAHVQTN